MVLVGLHCHLSNTVKSQPFQTAWVFQEAGALPWSYLCIISEQGAREGKQLSYFKNINGLRIYCSLVYLHMQTQFESVRQSCCPLGWVLAEGQGLLRLVTNKDFLRSDFYFLLPVSPATMDCSHRKCFGAAGNSVFANGAKIPTKDPKHSAMKLFFYTQRQGAV